MQAAPTAPERLAHVMKAQHYAALMLTTSLTAAGARSPQSASITSDSAPAEARSQRSTEEAVAAASDAAGDRPPDAGGQLAAPQALSNTSTAVTSAPADTAAAAAAVEFTNGLAVSDVLPSQLLDWAHWQPTAALLAALAAASGKLNNSNSSGYDTLQAPPQLSTAARGAGEAQGLGSAALQVPELLLAHLQLLAGSLRESGQHLQALPVLQLARLVATVALNSQVKNDQSSINLL